MDCRGLSSTEISQKLALAFLTFLKTSVSMKLSQFMCVET